MMSLVLRARQAMAWAAAGCVAVLAASCGSVAAPGAAGPTATVTVTAPGPGASSAGASGPAAPSGGSGPCSTSALRVSLGSQEGAAAGHLYRTLDFTNISGASCTLYGYPGISFVASAGGKQIGAAANRSPASKRLVVLAPGKTAHALLDLLDVLNFPPSVCAVSNAHWIKVYPPNQFSASYVRLTAKVCSKPTPVYMSVAPVSLGA
ncbi:MAG TPA: DUF4232 domain-containing protein [Streptosporangiaceae bacterium]|nr:DUF4232 domain-containing protein [Streptosporangiaceae bacterium]